eukprot:13718253-Alexandrium_andersonii.AAC.1
MIARTPWPEACAQPILHTRKDTRQTSMHSNMQADAERNDRRTPLEHPREGQRRLSQTPAIIRNPPANAEERDGEKRGQPEHVEEAQNKEIAR